MRKATLTAGAVRFRASTVDVRRLAQLGKHYEMTTSALLRRIIADAWRAAGFGEKPHARKG
jgi:hypothetical protein